MFHMLVEASFGSIVRSTFRANEITSTSRNLSLPLDYCFENVFDLTVVVLFVDSRFEISDHIAERILSKFEICIFLISFLIFLK